MSDKPYTRPKIERARLANPERGNTDKTELENEVQTIARSRTTQSRGSFVLTHHQYDAPFFYTNFRVELGRPWENATNHSQPDLPEDAWGVLTDDLQPGYVGAEFNSDGVELDVPPYGAITFVEEEFVRRQSGSSE